jgi:cell division initiation protein
MFTPQQIEEVSFKKATFGGYDMQAVDEFLEPLTQDYITLYKENALLKSKMRVLVEKLEEYRNGEASMREAMAGAQRTCDQMVRDTEVKCAQMLNDANLAAAENAKNAVSLIAAENARVEEAKKAASQRINEIQEQLKTCVQALERIKTANLPAELPKEHAATADAVADEIASTLEAMMGPTVETAPKAEPHHPQSNTTSRFTNLQFGRNYDPTK